MIKYETINGTLCRMVEQPCPHCGQPEIIAERVEDNSRWWALWQMRNGNAVYHTKAPSIKYSMPTHYVKRRVRENCTDDMSIEVWLSGADEFGWQIYEPQPEPAKEQFEVGDWVEIEVSGVLSQQQATSGVFADSIKCGGVEFYANGNPVMQPLNARIIRKLSCCEVKVRVALEGTVRKSQLNGCFVLDTPMPGNAVHTIRLVELDPNTAELVNALLKAQEE